jgi:hypothetical protein
MEKRVSDKESKLGRDAIPLDCWPCLGEVDLPQTHSK